MSKKSATSYEVSKCQDVLSHAGPPTYSFKVGDHPRMGCWQDCEVTNILEPGIYEVHLRSEKHTLGQKCVDERDYLVPWPSLRPQTAGITNFETNQDIRLYYNSSTIESLISSFLSFGFDMDPPYQRDHVWTGSDREALLDTIFMHGEIGRFVLRQRGSAEENSFDILYEVVDGKQRISTIVGYYLNRFDYKGVSYNDLSPSDRRCFLETTISVANMGKCTQKDALRVFLMLNQSGHPMDKEVLSNAKKLLSQL